MSHINDRYKHSLKGLKNIEIPPQTKDNFKVKIKVFPGLYQLIQKNVQLDFIPVISSSVNIGYLLHISQVLGALFKINTSGVQIH